MKNLLRLLLAHLLMGLCLAEAGVSITSYNMGQLKKRGVDLVACTSKRVGPQIEAIFDAEKSPLHKQDKFVIFLQEAWTKRIFRALKAKTDELGLFMTPQDYKQVENSGQISITNMVPLEVSFIPFTSDPHAAKGMLYLQLDLGEGKKLGALNVHTAYSGNKNFSRTHADQFSEVSRFVGLHRGNNDHFVVGGDFNAGPDLMYKRERYKAAEIIWDNGFMPLMEEQQMDLITGLEKKTWDYQNNSLVNKPTFLIRLVNFFESWHTNWAQRDSTIDHIFVTRHTEVGSHEVVFDEGVRIPCRGRQDKEGKVPLSDHYGVNAILNI